MRIDDFLRHDSEWLKGTGPNSDIVMSSRTRLARNIDKLAFSHWADKKQQETILTAALDAAESVNYLKDALFIRLKDLSEVDRAFLVERHLISLEHAKDVEFKALIVDPKEIISIMVNEEDHLRMQVLQSGFNLMEAWRIIDALDTELSKKLSFAYFVKWGYLTACPTNTGTGLRGSIMLHLPALVFTGQISKILQATAKLGLNIRGLYGEGTEASGNLFQVSNQVSLGRTEEDIIDNIERIINQIIAREEATRRNLLAKNRDALVDRVWRAYGTLKSAHIITSNETIALLSAIRLGVDLGVVKNLDRRMVNELLILTQPAHLQKLEGKVLNSNERDMKRAELIRERLK
ncbi:MAG: protein arginine kinase [Omnitrophica bacterium RIFCSPHIGHO2_02_FULL_46_20]|nr:MAG: protein arginine kinase [Omnitrophica bacterium RIFCSPHIGHO2_02_FULL_46_20]OGW93056.1 MAG: protein arginine kinase [Omnitrophica bacterium RIFCSPLOWO2_12_FULL_45_13]